VFRIIRVVAVVAVAVAAGWRQVARSRPLARALGDVECPVSIDPSHGQVGDLRWLEWHKT